MTRAASHGSDRHAAISAAIAVVAAVHWLATSISYVQSGDNERIRNEAQLFAEQREIRAQLADCRRAQ